MNFSKVTRTQIRKVLNSRGLNIVRMPNESEVRTLLNALRPLDVGIPLIRLGKENDGGYLVPDDLHGITDVFSPGVALTWSFEEEIQKVTGSRIHLIESGEVPHACPYEVTQGFLGGFTSNNRIGINEWITNCVPAIDGDFLLQMDIEGGEYEVIQGISHNLLDRFRVIIIEFHSLQLVADVNWFRGVFEPSIARLLGDFIPVHAHANNASSPQSVPGAYLPETLEMTFLRKDRAPRNAWTYAQLPHDLDEPNCPSTPEYNTTSIWLENH